MAIPADTVLGSYRLVERIGRGGMGEAYRARHRKRGNAAVERAAKVLPGNPAGAEGFLHRFARAAASAAALDHPHVLPGWDYGEQDGAPYPVRPYIRGGTLKERLAGGPPPRAAGGASPGQMAAALDYAHARGLVHRDVKPANMLLDGRGRLYLADCGIAKAPAGGAGLTRSGVGVGTPEYMAPERAPGRADPRADLYARGVVLYQLLTGQMPSGGAGAVAVLLQHQREPPPLAPPRGATPPVSARLEAVVRQALAKDPDERYQTGRALVEALRAAPADEASARPESADTVVLAGRGDGPVGAGSRSKRRPPPALAVVGILALLLLCGATGAFLLARTRGNATAGTVPTSTTGASATATLPAAPATPPTASRTPLAGYTADFTTWPIAERAGAYRTTIDPATGEYRVALLQHRSGQSLYAPGERLFADFVLEVDARRLAGPEEDGYGLVFRRQPKGPNDVTNARYIFYVTPRGYFRLTLIGADGVEQDIQPLIPSSAINRGNAVNRLTVTCRGNHITLAANGQPLGAYTAPVAGAGEIGIVVATPDDAADDAAGIEAAFGNLRVSPAP